MKITYSIIGGQTCITDGSNRDDVVSEAREFYEQQLIEDGQFGSYEIELELVADSVDGETVEPITLKYGNQYEDYIGQHSLNRQEMGVV